MSDATPQSPSVPKPRNTISPSAAYIALHQRLESVGADTRRADALWKRAEESLFSEMAERDRLTSLRNNARVADSAVAAAEAAYRWYNDAIRAAGTPPEPVRLLAEPLRTKVIDEQRKAATIKFEAESATPEFQDGPAPHMQLIHKAEAALIGCAADRAVDVAQEVAKLIEADEALYREHPEHLPDSVAALTREVAALELSARGLGASMLIKSTFDDVLAERGFKSLIESHLDFLLGRRVTEAHKWKATKAPGVTGTNDGPKQS